jgi:ATP-dependent DNA helicase RecQ
VLASSGSGIVYCPTRKAAAEVHRMVVDARVPAALYHGGLAAPARHAAQEAFMTGKARVVVATHAFGMGVDKADIRFVHHAGLPASLEQYVQEIGRAGRDGEPASCWLVHSGRDYHVQRFMIGKSFPPEDLLANALNAANDFVQGAHGQSPAAVVRHLQGKLGGRADELAEALEVLCREGLLTRLNGLSGGPRGGDDVLIAEAPGANPAAFLTDYPRRKADTLAKLEQVKTYVGLTSQQPEFLAEYFRR